MRTAASPVTTIRAKASAEKIRLAEQAYAGMKSGRTDVGMREGIIVKRTIFRGLNRFGQFPVEAKMNALTGLMAALFASDVAILAHADAHAARWLVGSSSCGIVCALLASLLFRRGVAA